ncbi:MAG TPA: hypothetical protein VMB20_02710 [Candidatus Acidoferrum sp.]|nr:hypothetical protein [Candidatus Acidoferrum sp.]
MKSIRSFTAMVLILALPAPALAQQHGGGGRPSGGGARPAPQARPAAPAQRPAPSRPAPPPQTRPAQPGYSLPHDTQRPPANAPSRPPNNNPGYRPPPPPAQRPPATRPPNPYYRPPNYRPTHPVVIVNPRYHGNPAWYWNRGVAWYPAPAYWGGGFWGTLAIAATSAAIFGYIAGSSGDQYVSYQVQPNSPGAQLLQAYSLTQTPCGPPNLVVIYGPDNSVICAYPNNLVSAGTYSVDPSTLTISSY